MKSSLITTERNEADSIAEFIESALDQSLTPDEIIIADGGSTDGTIEIIQGYIAKGAPIKLLRVLGNRSVGRNAATKAARNNVIAVTDVGSRLDRDWLRNITKPFRQNPEAMAVAGNFKAAPQSFFENVSATLILWNNDNIDLETWLPSSRSVAYKKEAWAKVGGYPEHTNFNEDTPFDLALKGVGYKFEDGLKAMVYWRPRPNTKEFYRQYYFYALGDGIDRIGQRRIVMLTTSYSLLIATVIICLIWQPLLVLLPLLYFAYYLAKRIYRPWRKLSGWRALFLMAFLTVVYDASQVVGYWMGLLRSRQLSHGGKLPR